MACPLNQENARHELNHGFIITPVVNKSTAIKNDFCFMEARKTLKGRYVLGT